MGMRANAVLAYGIIVDSYPEIVEAEYDGEMYLFIEDEGLDLFYLNDGQYLICSHYIHVDWDEPLEDPILVVEDKSIIEQFVKTFYSEKEAKVLLVAYYG
tara:strand:- start:220 stop:519 length:300 start_codon:yes stop_codon:yes gene_type:complete